MNAPVHVIDALIGWSRQHDLITVVILVWLVFGTLATYLMPHGCDCMACRESRRKSDALRKKLPPST